MRAIERIVIKIGDGIYRAGLTIIHYFMCMVYWSGGRKVPSVRDRILLMSATELAKRIREEELTCESVVRAYIRRILIVEPYINATADRLFNEALEEAREVDALIKSGRVNKSQLANEKPLLGVPFTVKMLFTVKGLRKTGGSLYFKDEVADEDAASVELMKEAGAILLTTTNAPEAGCSIETFNLLYGNTCNPYDTGRTSGGSSGGECALLAAAGSVIGLGNDLGGSIRIPCMLCGVFGHKPTRGFVTNDGTFPSVPEILKHILYTGPICRYATDLVTTMKILATPTTMFQQKVSFENLKVHYLFCLGDIEFVDKVDADIRECIQKVASYFETKHGSTVKEASLPILKMGINISLCYVLSRKLNFGRYITDGRTDISASKETFNFLVRRSEFTFGPVIFLPVYHAASLIFKEKSQLYYEEKLKELDEELDNLLDERSVLVMPTLPFTAPYHYEARLRIPSTFCYSAMFNFTGHPVTQCPVGFNRKGLPLGVQIVGRKGNDHLTIACAIELEKAFGGWKPPN